MKTKVSPTVVGFFVLGAFFLGIIALLSFGSFNFLTKPEQFVVYFDESVSGLDQGSPVKFRGVRVGRVAKISVTYNAETKQSVVAVLCEFNRNVLTDTREQIQKLDTATISTEITSTAQAYRDIAQSPRIPSILEKFDKALGDLSSTLQEIEGAVEPTAAELALTLKKLRGSLDSLETTTDSASRFIAAQSGLGTEAADALRQLGEAARAVGRLADYLERNPNALISGRTPPGE